MSLPKVSIIIVNWNGIRYLKECFDSVFSQTYPNYEVVFVDNGSIDGSVEFVRENFPTVKIIENGTNLGFAKGTNIGISMAQGDYIATLNNDTKVEPMWLNELVKVAETKEDIGACASKMLFFYEREIIDNTGILISFDGSGINRGFKEMDKGQYDKNSEVFGACAGAALYKKKMLDEIGLFDEDFFAYYEDLDLAWRAQLAGWRCVYVHSAMVYHIHSATGISYSLFKLFYLQRNRFFIIIKNLPIKMAMIAIFYTPVRYLVLLNNIRLKKGHSSNFKKKNSSYTIIFTVVKSWICVLIKTPNMIRKRKNINTIIKHSNADIKKRIDRFVYL